MTRRRRAIVLNVGHPANVPEDVCSELPRQYLRHPGDEPFEAGATFTNMPIGIPEAPESDAQPGFQQDFPLALGPIQGSAKVVVVCLEDSEPLRLLAVLQSGQYLLGPFEIEVAMAIESCSPVPRFLQAACRELPNGFQQSVARVP